jgi:tripartite-type tricarboxylate transporter receptor subunit TctC
LNAVRCGALGADQQHQGAGGACQSRPNGLNHSSTGYGLQQHLAAEEIAQRTGGKFTHVAYRGGGSAMTT